MESEVFIPKDKVNVKVHIQRHFVNFHFVLHYCQRPTTRLIEAIYI